MRRRKKRKRRHGPGYYIDDLGCLLRGPTSQGFIRFEGWTDPDTAGRRVQVWAIDKSTRAQRRKWQRIPPDRASKIVADYQRVF